MRGAILAEDVPKVLEYLQSAIEKLTAESSLKISREEAEQDDWKEKPVAVAHRVMPLIEWLTAATN